MNLGIALQGRPVLIGSHKGWDDAVAAKEIPPMPCKCSLPKILTWEFSGDIETNYCGNGRSVIYILSAT
jgi:hypothetical protein